MKIRRPLVDKQTQPAFFLNVEGPLKSVCAGNKQPWGATTSDVFRRTGAFLDCECFTKHFLVHRKTRDVDRYEGFAQCTSPPGSADLTREVLRDVNVTCIG